MLSGLEGLLADRPVTHVRWGLERIDDILEELGRPERSFRALHIGGTNGKGSVAACAHAVLEAAGLRSGLYTSPHLVHPRERVRATHGVPPGLLDRCADRVRPLADARGATYFEAITAVAFLAFAELRVEWAVLETGLGGRLDATNVVVPAACAIVTVAVDHAAILGDSLEAIAGEKAGILKPGVPTALGRLPSGARAVVVRRAAELESPLVELGRDAEVTRVEVSPSGTRFEYRSRRRAGLALRTPLVGSHQADNAAVALMSLEAADGLELSDDALRRGVVAARLPGRFHVLRGPVGTWVLDIAHNPAGAAALRATLEAVALPTPVVFLVGVLGDKPWAEMAATLLARDDRAVLTVPPSAPAGRRWNPGEATRFVPGGGEVVLDFAAALRRARELAGGGTVVVTGSVHTVGDALAHLEVSDAVAGTASRIRDTPGEGE